MKSERRHELEKNELADRLATGIESTRSYLPQILGGIGLLVVAAIAWGVYSGYSKRQASVAWTEFYFNLTRGDADSFIDVAEDHPGSSAAGWARQIAGDNYLQRGINSLYRDKAEAKDLIGKAIEAFEAVDQAGTSPDLRNKALLGLAQAYESLGDVEKASNYYQQLGKAATDPGLLSVANERLAFLTSKPGKDFYDWFSQLDPKPDAPISLPSDMLTPPTIPDLQFGPTDTQLNDATGATAPPAEEPNAAGGSPAGGLPAGGQVPIVSEVTTDSQLNEPSAATEEGSSALPTDGGLQLDPKP
jgi:tetratricopeptide (TPR) repeat protein